MHETINPIQFASFVQSKMEFESMIINLGLRYDFFNPNFAWFDEHNTYNPAINTSYDELMDPDGNQIDSLGNIQYAFENIFYLTGKAKVTQGKRLTQGHRISYDTERSLATVRASKGNGRGGKLDSREGGRVRIIIPPKESVKSSLLEKD